MRARAPPRSVEQKRQTTHDGQEHADADAAVAGWPCGRLTMQARHVRLEEIHTYMCMPLCATTT